MFCEAHDVCLYVVHVVESGVEIFVIVEGANTIQVCVVQNNGSFVLRTCCISDKVVVAFVYCVHS